MRREDLQREIAQLDEEITRIIGSVELPQLKARTFPASTWLFAALCFAYVYFGFLIPGSYQVHMETHRYARWLGWAALLLALVSTLRWLFRGRGYQAKSAAYTNASRRARELQEKRQELQAELRAMEGQ